MNFRSDNFYTNYINKIKNLLLNIESTKRIENLVEDIFKFQIYIYGAGNVGMMTYNI